MAKDFDFLPAKNTRTTQAAPKQPASRRHVTATKTRKPSLKKPASAPARTKPKTAASEPPRVHLTRSTLIDYHPPKKPVMPPKQATPKTYSAPPYLPPARVSTKQKVEKPKPRFNKRTTISAVVAFVGIALLASGLLIPILENPSVTILIYIVAAIIFRLNSRVSFSIALLLLLAIPLLLLVRNSALAGTYAVFCFYFLVVGVISATIELRKADN